MDSINERLANVNLRDESSELPLALSYTRIPAIPAPIAVESAQVAYASLLTSLLTRLVDHAQGPWTRLLDIAELRKICSQRFLISRLSFSQLISVHSVLEKMSEARLSKLPACKAVIRVFYYIVFAGLRGDPREVGNFGLNSSPTMSEVIQAAMLLEKTALAATIGEVFKSASFLMSLTRTDLDQITTKLDHFSPSQLLQLFTGCPLMKQGKFPEVLVIFTAERAIKRHEEPGSHDLYSICLDIIKASEARFSTYDWVSRIWDALSTLPFNEHNWTTFSPLRLLFVTFYSRFSHAMHEKRQTLLRLPTPPALPAAILAYEPILKIIIGETPDFLHEPLHFGRLADFKSFVRIVDFFLAISSYDDGAYRRVLSEGLSFLASALHEGLSKFLKPKELSSQLVKMAALGTLHSFALLCQYHRKYSPREYGSNLLKSLFDHIFGGHHVSPYMLSIAIVHIPGFKSRLVIPPPRSRNLLLHALLHLRHSMPATQRTYKDTDGYIRVVELDISVWPQIFRLSNQDLVTFARVYAYIQLEVPYWITLKETLIHEQDDSIVINENVLAGILRTWVFKCLASRLVLGEARPIELYLRLDTGAIMPE